MSKDANRDADVRTATLVDDDPAPSAHLRELPRTTSAGWGRASLRPDLGGRKTGRWSPVLGTPGPSPVPPVQLQAAVQASWSGLFSNRATLPSLILKTCSKAASSSAPLFALPLKRPVTTTRSPWSSKFSGSARELVEVLRDRAEHVVADALRTVECAGGALPPPGSIHYDVLDEDLQHPLRVAAVELVVGAANRLHILFRHGFSSPLCAPAPTLCRSGRGVQGLAGCGARAQRPRSSSRRQ